MSGIYNICVDGDERLFQKVLKNIVNKDIHSDSLGCAIRNTHIRVGNYHLTTFYQAEILFGNLFWSDLLADWLCERIIQENSDSKDIILIGYEAYTGLLLQTTKEKINRLNEQNKISFSCPSVHTFEEKNYDLSTDSESESHFHPSIHIKGINKKRVVFICGVGLTAKTYNRMENTLKQRFKDFYSNSNSIKQLNVKKSFYTLIQIFPDDYSIFSSEFKKPSTVILKPGESERQSIERTKSFISNNNETEVSFCVSINSEWHRLESCPKCFGESETTLIETNGIPIIPMQQMDPYDNERIGINRARLHNIDALNLSSISIVGSDHDKSKDVSDLVDKEYSNKRFYGFLNLHEIKKDDLDSVLRYGHINMNGHHYQYYFKTDILAELLNKRLYIDFGKFRKNVNKLMENPDFLSGDNAYSLGRYAFDRSYSDEALEDVPLLRSIVWMIRKLLSGLDNDDIIVIVAPNHYGNSLFPLMVNKYIFGNKAQIIGFDSRKMFRSNFLVEYSNYSLFDAFSHHKVHYFFVDDEIIDGKTYDRTKSLMRSLIERSNYLSKEKKTFNFSGCITLINRQSEKAINSFDNNDKYFYFYSGNVPTLKIYDNLCPLCKESEEYKLNISKTALSSTSDYWKREYVRHNWRILSRADDDSKQKKERAIERFIREETLYARLKTDKTITKVLQEELDTFYADCTNLDYNADRIISVIKALTKPYLCFKEDVRDEALKFTKAIYDFLLHKDTFSFDKTKPEDREAARERWHLLVSVLKALGRMGSNELLNSNILIDTYNKLKELFTCSETLNEDEQTNHLVSIYCAYVLIGNVKRVLTGVDGKNKSIYFANKIYEQITPSFSKSQNDLYYLFISLYLESNMDIFNEIEKGEKNNGLRDNLNKSDTIVENALTFKSWLSDQLACLESGTESDNKAFNDCIDCFVHSPISDKATNYSISPLFHYMLEGKMFYYIDRYSFDLSDRLELTEECYLNLDGMGIYRETTSNYDSNSNNGKGVYYWIKIDEASMLDTILSLVNSLEYSIENNNLSTSEAIINVLYVYNFMPNFTLIDKRQYNDITLEWKNLIKKADKKAGEQNENYIDLDLLTPNLNKLKEIIKKTVEREEKVVLDRGVKNIYIAIDVAKFLDTVKSPEKTESEFIKYLRAMLSVNYYNVCAKYLNNKVIDKYTQSVSYQKALTMSKASNHDMNKHLIERSAIRSLENLKPFDLYIPPKDIEKNTADTHNDKHLSVDKIKLAATDNYFLLVNQFIVNLFRWISVNGERCKPSIKRELLSKALIDPKPFANRKTAKLIYAYSGHDKILKEITINILIEESLIEKELVFRRLDDDFILSIDFPAREILFALIFNSITHSLNNHKDNISDIMNVRMFRDNEMWCVACGQLTTKDLQSDVENARNLLAISPAFRENYKGLGITLWSLKKYFDCLNKDRPGVTFDLGVNFDIYGDTDTNEFIVKMRCIEEEVKTNGIKQDLFD
ncbi:MAG: hypothetical protein IKP88_05380 [Lachnospiraceae bacterium]|nr:hypothetical protein [Lachnospiraceae bacterium]